MPQAVNATQDLGEQDPPHCHLGQLEHHVSAIPELIASLQGNAMLLVLDNCEHVIETAAPLAARILRGAPGVQILATSREPLRAEGEHVHRLPPLQTPRTSVGLTAAEALGFPAVRLFVERATATLGAFELHDAGAPICRGPLPRAGWHSACHRARGWAR